MVSIDRLLVRFVSMGHLDSILVIKVFSIYLLNIKLLRYNSLKVAKKGVLSL